MTSWRDVRVAICDTSCDTAANSGYVIVCLTRTIVQPVSMITMRITVAPVCYIGAKRRVGLECAKSFQSTSHLYIICTFAQITLTFRKPFIHVSQMFYLSSSNQTHLISLKRQHNIIYNALTIARAALAISA